MHVLNRTLLPLFVGSLLTLCLVGRAVAQVAQPDAAPARVGPQPETPSLAALAPADVGLYVEMRDADDLLIPLAEPQLWTTLAELAGQPAHPEDAELWRLLIRRTIGMEPADAIRTLFSDRVAFMGDGIGRSQDAVVLCRMDSQVPVSTLLDLWRATPTLDPGLPQYYSLRNHIGLGSYQDALLFGDKRPTEGLFRRALRFLAAGAPDGSLANDATYRDLLSRVPPDPDGVLFARLLPVLPSASASQPASGEARARVVASDLPQLPGPLRGADHALIALHRRDALLHFTAVGDGPVRLTPPAEAARRLVERLPADTLFAWGGRIDWRAVGAAAESLPERNVFRMAFDLQERGQGLDRLLDALNDDTCLAIGAVRPRERAADAPPLPAVAVLVHCSDPAAAGREFALFVQSCVTVSNFVSLAAGVPLLPPIESLAASDASPSQAVIQRLDLTQLLGDDGRKLVGELELCWATTGDALVVATHCDWLRAILAASGDRRGALAEVVAQMQHPIPANAAMVTVMQTGPLADLGQMWVNHLRRVTPEIFDERWWRQRQPNASNVQLGIDVTEDGPNQRLRVDGVTPRMPCAGLIQPGDQIIGVNNRRFRGEHPIHEMRRGLDRRPHNRYVDLLVEREGNVFVVRVSLPFIDPMQMLQRVVAVGRLAQRVAYCDFRAERALPRGTLTIELRRSPAPLIDFRPSPTSAPSGVLAGD